MSDRDEQNLHVKELIDKSKRWVDVFLTDPNYEYGLPDVSADENLLTTVSPGALQKMYESAERAWVDAGDWFFKVKAEVDRRNK